MLTRTCYTAASVHVDTFLRVFHFVGTYSKFYASTSPYFFVCIYTRKIGRRGDVKFGMHCDNSPSCWDFHPVHYLGGHFTGADETRIRSGTSVVYTSILGPLNFAPTLVGHCVKSVDSDLLYGCKCTRGHISTCISYLSERIPNFTPLRRLIFFACIYTTILGLLDCKT